MLLDSATGMPPEFNDFVRKRLSLIGISQREAERALGYADNGLRNVLKGRIGPRLQDLPKLTEVLKLTPAEARTLRDLALRAHGYDDLADELHSLHARVDALTKRIDRLEQAP
jgi:transcriptional regulator with XRE-family HTH domain